MTTTYTISQQESATAGVALGWSGGEAVAIETFAAACEAIGVEAPEPLSFASALERAIRELAGRQRLSRSYADANGVVGQRKRGRRALVDENVHGRDLTYSVRLRAEVTKEGELFVFDQHDCPVSHESHPQWAEAQTIVDKVQWHAEHLDAADVKTWLISVVTRRLDGVSILRERGGVYYVPPHHVPLLSLLRQIVTQHCQIRTSVLACVTNDADTVATILDGIAREVEEATAEAEAQCIEGAQARTYEKHKTALGAVQQKLTRYEALCATAALSLQERIATVQGHVMMAALGEMGAPQ